MAATQLRQEEERFARTLNSGTDLAQRELERLKRAGVERVPGSVVFDLYQSRGIPVELLEEFAQEEGLALDREGFEAALEEERQRGQASWKGDVMARFRPEYEDLAEAGMSSSFAGYDCLELPATAIALIGSRGDRRPARGRRSRARWCSTSPRSTPSRAARWATAAGWHGRGAERG